MNATIAGTKNKLRILFIISALFMLVIVICLIINYSIDRSINWSLYPIGALIVIWATILPLFTLKKFKEMGLFAGLTITLIPFLFLIQSQTSEKGWVEPLALPIAILALLAFGISLIAFTQFNLNKFYPFALTVFLFGVIVNYGVGLLTDNFLNESNGGDLVRILTISISVVLSLSLIIICFIKKT